MVIANAYSALLVVVDLVDSVAASQHIMVSVHLVIVSEWVHTLRMNAGIRELASG